MQIDLEEDKTTYTHDFKTYKLSETKQKWDRADFNELVEIKTKPFVYEDHETFEKCDGCVHIPFNLLWTPKPILQTIPQCTVIKKHVLIDDYDRRKRPRVIVAPAVSLDDARETLASDAENQDLLTKFTYTTTYQKSSQLAALPISPREVPNTTLETAVDPVKFQCEDIDEIPGVWRRLAKDWDKLQNRYVGDPTRAFWERTAMQVKCGACEQNIIGRNIIDPETKEKIRILTAEDRLRLAHDIPMSTYAGYMPRLPLGVPLEKKQFKASDPRLSVSQAYNRWKEAA